MDNGFSAAEASDRSATADFLLVRRAALFGPGLVVNGVDDFSLRVVVLRRTGLLVSFGDINSVVFPL
jgi:hypothetical protein